MKTKTNIKVWQLLLLVFVIPTLFILVNIVTKPAALVNKATDTTKMLQNYEWFYEASNNFNARVSQITTFKKMLEAELDPSEKSRLRIDLAAMQQSCREMAAKYEAQSGKVHVGYLKSNSLPASLNPKECE